MSDFNLIEVLAKLGFAYLPFLFALCFHEFAHGWVALKKGDNTAQVMGRLSMNPFVHADLLGTFILPIAGILAGIGGMNGGSGFIFGWAKPVPVNGRNLRDYKSDMFWIALAGPLSNILLALVATFVLVVTEVFWRGSLGESVREMAFNFVLINVLLAVFNLIPLHPLDGGKVLARFIPEKWNRLLEENQNTLQFVLIAFFMVGGFAILRKPMFLIITLLETLANSMVHLFL